MWGQGKCSGRKHGWNRHLAPSGNRIRRAECGRRRYVNADILFGHGGKGLAVLLIGQHRGHLVQMEPVMAVVMAAGCLSGRHGRTITVAGAITTTLTAVGHDLFPVMVAEAHAERIHADEHGQHSGPGPAGRSASVILYVFMAEHKER